MWTQRTFNCVRSVAPRITSRRNSDKSNHRSLLRSLSSTTTSTLQQQPRVLAPITALPAAKEAGMLGIAAAVGAVGLVAGLGKLYWDASSSFIDVEEMRQILTNMITVINQVALELQRAKAEALSKNPEADKDALNKEMQQTFYYNISRLEEQIMSTMGVTGEAFNASLQFHLENDSDVQKLVAQMQATMKQSMEKLTSPPVDVPMSLTCRKLLGILQEMSDMTMAVLKETIAELNREGVKDAKNPNAWMPAYQEKTDARVSELLKKYDLTQDILYAAMLKYEKNEEYVQQMEKMQAAQQQEFEKLNIQL